MRRLAIFWLACAAVGFLAAVCAACVLSLAVDGSGSWRAVPAARPASPGKGAQSSRPSEPAPIVAPALKPTGD